MKKILLFFCLLFSLLFTSTQADALSFAEAPTLADYIEQRGEERLPYILFALARLHFSVNRPVDWNELEMIGTELLQDMNPIHLAEFILTNTYQVRLTRAAYDLIADSLTHEVAVVEKNYFDFDGSYKPLNAHSILIRRNTYIDIANLFEANTITMHVTPYEKGYHYNGTNLFINNIKLTLEIPHIMPTDKVVGVDITTHQDRPSSRSIPFVGSIGNTYHYEQNAAGGAVSYNFFRMPQDYSQSLSNLRLLTGMKATIEIGDMKRVIHGIGTINSDLEINQKITIDPNTPVTEIGNGDGDNGSGDNGNGGEDSWWSPLFGFLGDYVVSPIVGKFNELMDFLQDKILDPLLNWLADFLLKPLLDFFDWVKRFFIPDFTGVLEKINELIDLITSKFSTVFQFIESFQSLFQSQKSLHDLEITTYGETLYLFPRSAFELAFQTIRAISGGAMVVYTLVRCYKRVTGEGDVIE
ncbi:MULTISPECIES: hypothetical protein [Enterococcus]|uniref:hypothetical protein n=1 Tax=Enterococcus TaxID=1350 RepID=UPI00230455B3|nr:MULTISPECIES: hypothetical protein [Enterococcus]MDA9428960.1 hypothetical protein [Enterococcus mundtii 1A]